MWFIEQASSRHRLPVFSESNVKYCECGTRAGWIVAFLVLPIRQQLCAKSWWTILCSFLAKSILVRQPKLIASRKCKLYYEIACRWRLVAWGSFWNIIQRCCYRHCSSSNYNYRQWKTAKQMTDTETDDCEPLLIASSSNNFAAVSSAISLNSGHKRNVHRSNTMTSGRCYTFKMLCLKSDFFVCKTHDAK